MLSTATEAVKAAPAGADDNADPRVSGDAEDVDPPPGTDDEEDYVYDIFGPGDEGEEEAPHGNGLQPEAVAEGEPGADAGSFMKVTLQWCVSGSVFKQVQVEAEDWGTVILGADKA